MNKEEIEIAINWGMKKIKPDSKTKEWYKKYNRKTTFILVNGECRVVCPGMNLDGVTLIPLPMPC